MSGRSLRVLVCGSTFGQFWMAALRRYPERFTLAGLLASGSARSRDCAARNGITLYTSVEALPTDIDIACVVLRAAVLGGEGSALAQRLMQRGIHVIQEQPVHHDEVADNLRCARQQRVEYRVGNLYPHLPAVTAFCDAARRLRRAQTPQFIDAACASQVAFPLLAMLAQALDTLRPWQLNAIPQPENAPFQLVQGQIGGVALTLRVHNEVDPADPDNHFHLLHQITVGFPAGRLTLTDTHGPLSWHPRLHIPDAVKRDADMDSPQAAHLMEATCLLDDVPADSWRTALSERWPQAIAVDLLALADTVQQRAAPRWQPQSLLTLCQVWQALTHTLGYPQLRPAQHFAPLPPPFQPAVRPQAEQDVRLLPEVRQRAETLIAGVRAQTVQAFVAAMDRACLNAMLLSLQQGGILTQADRGSDAGTILQQLRVAPAHQGLITRWLGLLAEAGDITQHGTLYFGGRLLSQAEFDASWQAVHAIWDNQLGSATFINYLWHNARLLGPLMRGEQQAAMLLFPEGRSDIAEAVYRHTITARYLNTLIADWIMMRLERDAVPLSVLEIGAGTGATSERVRETLEARYGTTPPLTWIFSDVSRFFLLNADRRYGHLPWISTALLDIDRPLDEQGVPPGSQGVLVMAGVLNNARNSEQTVRWLAQALHPGGHMLITEPTREHLEILTSQAFMMPPPEDDRQRSGLRFLTVGQWQDLFSRAGLEHVACLPEEGHPLAALGQRLFIVRRPPHA